VEFASTSLPRLPRLAVIRAIVRRDFLVTRSYRLAFGLDLVIGILNLAVFYFISQTFDNVQSADLNGAPSYFAFAAVGIAITVVIDAASTALAGRIREEQLTGTLEALLVQPIMISEISFGLAGFPFLFAMLRAVFYLAMAGLWLHVDLSHTSPVGFALILVAAGAAFSVLGVLLGSLVLIIKRGQVVVGMLIFGMGLVSGAFFPTSVLPDWIEPLGKVVPTRFAFDGIRSAVFQGTGWVDDAIALTLMSIIGIPIAGWVFKQALAHGKRTGSLTQY
jgi:ABC-2 type transport system permease protein